MFPDIRNFRLGDYQHEFGIIDGKYAPKEASKEIGGAIACWHVDDLNKTLDFLLAKGAKLYEPITDRSGGKMAFITASVVDPFGNILGIMVNEYYLNILNKNRKVKNITAQFYISGKIVIAYNGLFKNLLNEKKSIV